MHNHCELIPLIHHRACEIWMCQGCKSILLVIGPVSLRLKNEHFLQVADNLQLAAHIINQSMDEPAHGTEYFHSKIQH